MTSMTVESHVDLIPGPSGSDAPYWASARARRLQLPRCSLCAQMRYPATAWCPYCMAAECEWEPVRGSGRIYTFTVVHPSPGAGEGAGPHNAALVELDEGPRIWTRVVDCPPQVLRIGMRVFIDYERVNDQITLPVFRPVEKQQRLRSVRAR